MTVYCISNSLWIQNKEITKTTVYINAFNGFSPLGFFEQCKSITCLMKKNSFFCKFISFGKYNKWNSFIVSQHAASSLKGAAIISTVALKW